MNAASRIRDNRGYEPRGAMAEGLPTSGLRQQTSTPRQPELTHNCDGCEDDAPCGDCGGNLRRGSASYQALEWGILATTRVQSPFWRAALVGQVVRDSTSDSAEADDLAMGAFISGVLSAYTVNMQGSNAPLASLDQFERSGATPSESAVVAARGVISHRRPNGPVVTPSEAVDPSLKKKLEELVLLDNAEPLESPRVCCPLKFDYPLVIRDPYGETVAMSEGGVPLAYKVRRFFSFSATFEKETKENNCDCECCAFKQVILESELVYTKNASFEPGKGYEIERTPPSEPMLDDCLWLRQVGVGPNGLPTYEKYSGRRGHPPVGVGWQGPICYGDHKEYPAGSSSAGNGYSSKGCKFFDSDTPSHPTLIGSTWDWYWSSLGLIVDRCHANAIKRIAYLRWVVSGKTTEAGIALADNQVQPSHGEYVG
jgi:hypothetical protein